jgi:hypothetical protein
MPQYLIGAWPRHGGSLVSFPIEAELGVALTFVRHDPDLLARRTEA